MKISINGKDKILKAGATLKDAIVDEPYDIGSLIAIHLSAETVIKKTNDFEIVTKKGVMTLHLDDGPDADIFRSLSDKIKDSTSKWVTRKLVSFGAFPTEIKASSANRLYRKFDCYFSLGGGDNLTTYIMIAKLDHRDSYGAGDGRIGRITVGRHLIEDMREEEKIIDIRPLMSEINIDNVEVTKDLQYKLADGYSVYTNIMIKLDPESPIAAEHVLIAAANRKLEISDPRGSFIVNSKDLDVDIKPEKTAVREVGSLTVRNEGLGTGRIYIYKDKRQIVPSHSSAGKVVRGQALVSMAEKGDTITVLTDPSRALVVGMTQKAGEDHLANFGIEQVRKGDVSDDSIVVQQIPERTMDALAIGSVETFAVPKDKIYKIEINAKDQPTVHFFKKITGLNHKPIGALKVQFSFEGAQMITFYGDDERGKTIHPQDLFKKVKRGDIGITNQVRPMRGLIGIRLEDSKSYGPTGEESYGTNIVGKFLGDLDKMLNEADDEQFIYITEENI